ncbi:S1C family serine protease, partial [Phascolarctobacterium succinatutens]
INSAKVAVSGVEGIGFAIPINTAKPILQELAERGRVARPYLGASLMDQEISDRYGFEINMHGGIFIIKVVPGSPAAKADIRPGDILLSFNGSKVKTAVDLRTALSKCKVGERAEVVIMRNGQRESRTVVLEEVPKDYGN